MAYAFPSEEWIQEYERRLNEDDAYQDASEGWGVGFNGDFIFHIGADDRLPEDRYYFIGLENGDVYDCREIDSPDEVDWGFIIRGAYSDWVKLTKGEIGAIDGMMSGVFEIEGDMQKVLQYSNAAVAMTEVSSAIDTEFTY
ncbi:SCP2 sterol-binding domain-containing protein [Halorarius litoreus]|uniref:SCP2 sterol-binding domain-containing protein n=1 Tax=Halorarius litoreus TaxID=2962676 RepID=UPI0020CE6859|nr:SCP2 sterol-binding domain-containing protein [Halorarius litoreus]